tara:strand:+ start:181 stop:432 length:252 start_codon:yes stop_codon:yes gene_type:complete
LCRNGYWSISGIISTSAYGFSRSISGFLWHAKQIAPDEMEVNFYKVAGLGFALAANAPIIDRRRMHAGFNNSGSAPQRTASAD